MTTTLKYISIGLALIAIFICLTLFGEHQGFEQGWNLSSDFWNESTLKSSSFSIAIGPTTYGFLTDKYLVMGILLAVYIIGEIVTKKVVSKIICLSSLVLIFYQLWLIYSWYQLLIEAFSRFSVDPYFRLISNSTSFVWILFFISIVLLILQIIKLFAVRDQTTELQEKSPFTISSS